MAKIYANMEKMYRATQLSSEILQIKKLASRDAASYNLIAYWIKKSCRDGVKCAICRADKASALRIRNGCEKHNFGTERRKTFRSMAVLVNVAAVMTV
jgi:hypothetical protein